MPKVVKKTPRRSTPPGIEQKANGRFQVRWRDPEGTQRARSFIDYDDAERFHHTVRGAVASGAYADDRRGKVTFTQFTREYVATRQQGTKSWAPGSLTLYSATLDIAAERLGARPIGTITSDEIVAWCGWLVRPRTEGGRGLATTTAKSHLTRLRFFFAVALKRGVILRDPTQRDDVGFDVTGEKITRDDIPRPEEIRALMDGLPARYRIVVAIGALAGLRSGEIRGLRIQDVNPLRREVRVAQQLVRSRGGEDTEVVAEPKTTSSKRTVPVDDVVAAQLADHIATHRAGAAPGDLLIVAEDGGCLTMNALRHYWLVSSIAAGLVKVDDEGKVLPRYRVHDLRHVYASTLLDGGESLFTVSRRLGHASTAIVDAVYGHLLSSADDRTRAAMASTSAAVLSLPGAAVG